MGMMREIEIGEDNHLYHLDIEGDRTKGTSIGISLQTGTSIACNTKTTIRIG